MRFAIFGLLVVACIASVFAPRAGADNGLDGRTFEVDMSRADDDNVGQDVLAFDSGLFHSDMFAPPEGTLFTTHTDPDALHFEVGPYPVGDATVEWTGSVRGHQIEGEVRQESADGGLLTFRFDGEERL